MSLVNLKEILKNTDSQKYAVGNFDVFNIEMLKGVMQAAEGCKAPVILAYGEGFEDYINIEAFAPMLVDIAKKASVPVAVHLDHCVNYDFLLKAVNCGFTSVMIDASDKPFKENMEITKKVVEACRAFNVSVEAELGHVSGLENLYTSDEYIYTDPRDAVRFVEETGIDALAVAIGTVHGVYKEKPNLNIQRLKEIKASVNVPLVMHGGSGISNEDFRETIKCGISKINIFTDLTLVAMDCIRNNAEDSKMSYMNQCLSITEAISKEAVKKINLFGSAGKAVI